MIAVISDDRKFSKRCCDILESMGLMTVSIKHQFAKRALHCGAKAAIVHSGKDRSIAEKSTLALSKSDFKGKPIIAILTRNTSLPAKYIELEGSTDQIKLPCSDTEIEELVRERCELVFSFKYLTLGGSKRKAELLGYDLRLSEKEYYLLRLIIHEKGNPVLRRQLSYWMHGMTNNCMSVHVSSINKKAYEISGRKLVLFGEDSYYLNPYM